MSKPILTQSELKQIVTYNPETGEMFWTGSKKWGNDKEIGCTDPGGYRIVMINKKNYRVHRLAWLYVYGEFPLNQIDHSNHKRSDNRIANLVPVTNQQNQMNRRYTGNSSGIIGICWDKSRKKWLAHIKVNGSLNYLGRFTDLEEAISMRLFAESYYGFHPNHGVQLTE